MTNPTSDDIDRLVDTMVSGFMLDPLYEWLHPDARRRPAQLRPGIALALVYLYNTNTDFRKFVIEAWDAVSKASKKAWEDYIKPALDDFWAALKRLWDEVLAPFFAWLGPIIIWAAKEIIPLIAEQFGIVLGRITGFINTMVTVIGWIVTAVQWTWRQLKKIWGWIVAGVQFVKAEFSLRELQNGNFHVPHGNENGANAQWIPGGYLPDGTPETSFAIHPNSTPDDPSVGGTWGDFSKFVFGSKQASG